MNPDPHDLQRFVDAQNPVFAQVLAELSSGAKTSHWMWFVFPQLKQLGRSATARHFGLASRDEALAYWRHPVLGPRLKDAISRVLTALPGRTLHRIFGSPDDLKFKSCMTLFEAVAPEEPLFAQALDQACSGQRDDHTLALL